MVADDCGLSFITLRFQRILGDIVVDSIEIIAPSVHEVSVAVPTGFKALVFISWSLPPRSLLSANVVVSERRETESVLTGSWNTEVGVSIAHHAVAWLSLVESGSIDRVSRDLGKPVWLGRKNCS